MVPRKAFKLSVAVTEKVSRFSYCVYRLAQAMSGRYCCAAAGTAGSMLWP